MKAVNLNLQREILEKDSEMASMNCDWEVNKASQVLLNKIDEKNQAIYEYEHSIEILNAENENLSDKLCNSEIAVAKYLRKINDLEDTVHSLEDELERQSMINSELASHVEGLNSFIANSRRLDESLEIFNNNNNNNSIVTATTEFSPDHHSPLIKRRSMSLNTHRPIPILFQRNRNYYRSTTYKESERYFSIADEIQASGVFLEPDREEDEIEDTQLSMFFDSLLERRESVPVNKSKTARFLEQVREGGFAPEISDACNKLLSELKRENETLKKANETLALAQLATKRPKRGFKICVIS